MYYYYFKPCLSQRCNKIFSGLESGVRTRKTFGACENADARVYLHRRAISPTLRWRSSEREKKLSEPTDSI